MAIDLKPAMKLMERVIQAALRYQAPDGSEPGDPLKKSVKVRAVETPDGITFIPTFLKYGTYLNEGTGRYKVKDTTGRPWNPNPGKGKMGIKPRFWLNTQEKTKQVVNQILAREVAKQIKKEFRTKK